MNQSNAKSNILIITVLTLYRLACFLLTRNYQYPDQHWQGPEVAHHLHYGYGYLTWQWTLENPLRNPLYPYLLSLPFYFHDIFNISEHLVYFLPQLLLQVPLTILADFFMIKILTNIYSDLNVWMAIVVFGNWAYSATMIRTYANSFEACITIIGFYFWFTNGRLGNDGWKDYMNRFLAIVAYIGRATSVIIWGLLWPYQLYEIVRRKSLFSKKSLKFVLKNIKTILLMISSSFLAGTIFNGKPTLTEYNFIKYNFIQKWSQLYGQQPLYFYFLVTLPFMLGFGLIPLLYSLISILSYNMKWNERQQLQETQQQRQTYEREVKRQNEMGKKLTIIALFSIAYVLINSLSVHKEHRFILPILPFILVISAAPFAKISNNRILSFIPFKLIAFFIIFLNIFIFATFNVWGKSDSSNSWHYIGQTMTKHNFASNQTVVIVMGQSHFMIGSSALHRNIIYKIPDSSALMMAKNESQNKLLWQNPRQLYQILTNKGSLIPSFVIAQGKHLHHTAQVLANNGYRQTKFWRHCTIMQQIFIGFDSISVFQPIHRQQPNENIGKTNLFHQRNVTS